MIDYVTCKIDGIGYNYFKKKFTILLNIDYKSIRCFLSPSIVNFATDFYEDKEMVVATLQYKGNKIYVNNIRKLSEE